MNALRDPFVVQAAQSRPGTWLRINETPEAAEARKVRRARQQALVLMIGSSLLSVGVLYGIWALFNRLVFSVG